MRNTDAISRLRAMISKPQLTSEHPNSPGAALPGFVDQRAVTKRCDLCGVEIASQHQHLVEPINHRLACACDPCAMLFSNQSGAKYRRVPHRLRYLSDFRLNETQWAGLMLPINLAFFVKSSSAGKILAFYPSPAGPTESLLDFESWSEIVCDNPVLNEMETDVEALLVNRIGEAREYYLAPIDECYKLVGLIRRRWCGLSGGAEVWAEIGQFFTGLKERSTTVRSESNA